jgi:L-alanine-DL-glutamate epimerase-like enolase superfamily enzyme
VRIEQIGWQHVRIPLKTAFAHARRERAVSDAVIVWIETDLGITGWGEIQPRDYVTGETIEGVLSRTCPAMQRRWAGRSFETNDEAVDFLQHELAGAGRDLAAFCGFELALLDAAGQSFEFPVGDLIGPMRSTPLPPGVVIGFEVETGALEKHCALLRFKKRAHVKVKVGRDDDLLRLTMVRDALGELPLRIDANMAWTAEEAIERLAELARSGIPIASIEQPVPASDVSGMAKIRAESGVPVMADEALCTFEDAERLIEASAVDVLNIRLGKNGGMLASRRLVELARAHRLGLHLGTMVGETGILSAASEIFGERVEEVACLEGKGQNEWLLARDVLADADRRAHGLGIAVSRSAVEQLAPG